MKFDESGRLLYVFKAHNDEWLAQVRELMLGPVGWCLGEWNGELFCREYDTHADFPGEFPQLLVHYRLKGLTPKAAVRELLNHPDFRYLADEVDHAQLQEEEPCV